MEIVGRILLTKFMAAAVKGPVCSFSIHPSRYVSGYILNSHIGIACIYLLAKLA